MEDIVALLSEEEYAVCRNEARRHRHSSGHGVISLNRLLAKWGCKPWKRADRRKKPLRDKMSWKTARAFVRLHQVLQLRANDELSFREIGERLGISHVAAWKLYRRAFDDMRAEQAHNAQMAGLIRNRLLWIAINDATTLIVEASIKSKMGALTQPFAGSERGRVVVNGAAHHNG